MSKIVLALYSFSLALHDAGVPWLPRLINKLFVRLLFGCEIGLGARIGPGSILGYGGLGVVIHPRVRIGARVQVGPGVTIGGTTKKYGVPTIGDDAIISSGAKILGPIHVGSASVIGANAVVLKDIPDHCVAAGVPAVVIKCGIDIDDYRDAPPPQ